ncbi:MAG: hypothetical protein IJT27_00530 [Clostridia bacterium]|nr:hypothetical protein [Clostridia bacterium]
MKKREDYLNASADMLCRQAYRMCKRACGAKDSRPDAKEIKETCSALKEAAALSEALRKASQMPESGLRIIFENSAEDYAV